MTAPLCSACNGSGERFDLAPHRVWCPTCDGSGEGLCLSFEDESSRCQRPLYREGYCRECWEDMDDARRTYPGRAVVEHLNQWRNDR